MSILEIINEVNLENGSNFKKSIFKKHIDNELFKRVLRMAYDKVRYSYGITMKNVVYTPENNYIEDEIISLDRTVDNMLNAVMPFRTMMVYTVERAFSELMLINHGDYRILKFQAEHPEWKPSAEEPEEIVMSCNGGMNYPSI